MEAAALPTAGMTAMSLVDGVLDPLAGKILLIVGAGGGTGSFATQFAVNAGARVIANVRQEAADRMHEYGVAETIDHTLTPLAAAVRESHPDGIDALLDLASAPDAFGKLAALVRPGGTAVSTTFAADTALLDSAGVEGAQLRRFTILTRPGSTHPGRPASS